MAILIQVQYKKEGQPTAARQGSAFEHLLSPRAKNRVINLEKQRVSASSKKLLIAMQSGHLRTPSDLCACVWIASITTRFSASQIILLVSSLDRFNVSDGPMSVLIDMGQNLGVLILNLDHLRFTPNHLFRQLFGNKRVCAMTHATYMIASIYWGLNSSHSPNLSIRCKQESNLIGATARGKSSG